MSASAKTIPVDSFDPTHSVALSGEEALDTSSNELDINNPDEIEFLAGLRLSAQQANDGQLMPIRPFLEKLRATHEGRE